MTVPRNALSFLVCLSLGSISAFASPVGTDNRLPLSVNDLGFNLAKMVGGQGNYFISPLSIYTALAMTYLGADGRTADQLEAAFKLRENGLSGQELHRSFQEILQLYQAGNDQYKLQVANGIFVQEGYQVRQQYAESLRNFYKAVIDTKDFVRNGEAAKNEINSWVAENTEDMIKELLSKPLDPLTRLILLNAVYFKGTWKTQFNKDATRDGIFYKNNNDIKNTKFMQLRNVEFPFYQDYETKHKFLELPYKGEDISMLVVLPERSAAEIELNAASLSKIRRSLSKTKLRRVVIPKFHLEFGKELKDALIRLGVTDLFNDAADLSGISGKNDLSVSSVLHKAVIDVNEEGSEAAAVTAVIIQVKSSILRDPDFVADHPFQFFIIDKRSGLVLFSGRLADP